MTHEPVDLTRLREHALNLEEAVAERTRLLTRAKRTWESTFDAIVDPLAIVDRDMKIVRTNLAHAAYSGEDVRRLNGRSCHEVMFRRDAPCEGCPVARTFADGRSAEGEITDEGRERVLRVWAFPMSSAELPGPPDQAVCHYQDVTDEKELQRQLLQSEKMAAVGTLAGGVAHEINNPLGAILAFAQLGLQDAPPGAPLHDYFTEIEQSALRCKRIVEGLLNFSRPSRGERRPVHLAHVVDQAVFLCRTLFDKRGVRLTCAHGEGLPAALADANQLQQVVVNLLSNAYRAMPSGGEIRVRTAATPGTDLRVIVEDEGHGIPERLLTKIFEPFFTTRADGTGTGLGLFVSYGIVKDHGGTIEVESRIGRGSRFDIVLPWPTDLLKEEASP